MKLIVTSLGKIGSASLDFKPLTVLIGQNNTNKSWTAYSAYSMLRATSSRFRFEDDQGAAPIATIALQQRIRELSEVAGQRIKQASQGVIRLEYSRESIVQPIEDDIRLEVRGDFLSSALGLHTDALKNAVASLTLPRELYSASAKHFFIQANLKENIFSYGESDEPIKGELQLGNLDNELRKQRVRQFSMTYFPKGDDINWTSRVNGMLSSFVLGAFSSVSALPSERNGLANLYRAISPDVLRSQPLVVRDYVRLLQREENYTREEDIDPEKDSFESMVEEILNGRVAFASEGKQRSLKYFFGEGDDVPIQAAASMIRSLSGLAVVSRSMSSSRNVLIIDEPEMNAHPSAQLAITELLAILANRGNYIIVTTHSPYVVDHVNNLLAAGTLNKAEGDVAAAKFVLSRRESFLNRDAVAAYEFGVDGEVKDMLSSVDNRIETSTFGSVSSRLENLYSDLLELRGRDAAS